MAKRPIRIKQANRLRKALRNTPETYIDLIDWLKQHRYAQTSGEAEKIILAGRVRSESHKLGIAKGRALKDSARVKLAMGRQLAEDDFEERDVVQRLVPAALRPTLTVVS